MLKKTFVPHRRNNYKPHLLRTEVTVFLLGVIFFLELIAVMPILGVFPGSGLFGEILTHVLVDSVNASRDETHAGPLAVNEKLVRAAQLKANDMATKGYFAHTSPEGIDPWHWLKEVDYSFTHAGENLAVNFIDSQKLHNAWMNSPSHRANILNSTYTEIGIATAEGTYNGRKALFVAQFFGRPVAPTQQIIAQTVPTPKPVQTPLPTPEQQVAASTRSGPAASTVVETTGGTGEPVDLIAPAGTSQRYSTFTETVASQPQTVARSVFVSLLTAIALALILTMLVRWEIQHAHVARSRLVLNGLALLMILTSLVLLNDYLATANAAIY